MTDSDLEERWTSIRQRSRFDVIGEDDVVEDPLPAITSNGSGSKQLAKRNIIPLASDELLNADSRAESICDP